MNIIEHHFHGEHNCCTQLLVDHAFCALCLTGTRRKSPKMGLLCRGGGGVLVSRMTRTPGQLDHPLDVSECACALSPCFPAADSACFPCEYLPAFSCESHSQLKVRNTRRPPPPGDSGSGRGQTGCVQMLNGVLENNQSLLLPS